MLCLCIKVMPIYVCHSPIVDTCHCLMHFVLPHIIGHLVSRVVEIRDLGGTNSTVNIRGLIKVVQEHGIGDRSFDYCIYGFAIYNYNDLFTECQHRYPDLCGTSTSIFVKTHQLVSANVAN